MQRKEFKGGLIATLVLALSVSVLCAIDVRATEKITGEIENNGRLAKTEAQTDFPVYHWDEENPDEYQAFMNSLSNGPTGYGVESVDQVSANAIITETISDIDIEHDLSAESVYNCMISLKAYFPEGKYWTNENFYAWNGGGRYYGGYGCAGFAFLLSDAAFGNLPARFIDSFDWDNFRVGDILRINNDTHSVIILEKHDDYVIVAEGNYNSSIHWGRKITKASLQNGFSNYATRYPADGSNANVLPAINKWEGPGASESNQNYPADFDDSTADDALVFSVKDVRNGSTERFHSQNGRYKILLFGGVGDCGNTLYNMMALSQIIQEQNLNQIEFWIFDIRNNSDSTIKEACDYCGITSQAKVINKTTEGSYWNGLYSFLLEKADEENLITDGSFYMPLIAFVDGEGYILGECVSRQSKTDLNTMLNTLGFIKANQETANKNAQIEAFVDRLYTNVLQRTYDVNGMNYWVDELVSGAQTGAEVAGGFFFSPEVKSRGLSKREYVQMLYNVMMNRTPDEDGLNYWLGLMENGYGREGVFCEFVESPEFKGICSSYGIKPGTYQVTGSSRNAGLSAFMSRLYSKVMGRPYDQDGFDYWCEAIYQGDYTLMQVCTDQFFHSQEFLNKNLDNVEYVKVLYRTFFGREYDQEGLNYWIAQMIYYGKDRDFVLNEFARSQEFGVIKAQYGF